MPLIESGDFGAMSKAALKLIVCSPRREIVRPSRKPSLPRKDNERGSIDVLLAANRWWRENPWPEPFNRTVHTVRRSDARDVSRVDANSVHLIITSPPYFNIKPYDSDANGSQLGRMKDYESFLDEIEKCMKEWNRVLLPGGRVCCIVGDVLIPRKQDGRHRILPLPADIMARARGVGLDALTPILWYKIGNRTNEAGGGSSGYYGKPYQPGAVIKNDFEHVLMLRKPGAYRSTSMLQKALSMLQKDEMDMWQRPFWQDIRGASLRNGHPAPYPIELAERLTRMFSFAGDTVLDPFCGSGSTAIAACRTGRNSISSDIEPEYVASAFDRLRNEVGGKAQSRGILMRAVLEKD